MNSASFLLPLGAEKLLKIHMVHPGLLLWEHWVYLMPNLVGRVKGNLVQAHLHVESKGICIRLLLPVGKVVLIWEVSTVPSCHKVMTWCAKGIISQCPAVYTGRGCLLVWPVLVNWRASTGRQEIWLPILQHLPGGNTPMWKRRGLPRTPQELPEKYSIFHMGSPSGLSAADDEIPTLLLGADLWSRL